MPRTSPQLARPQDDLDGWEPPQTPCSSFSSSSISYSTPFSPSSTKQKLKFSTSWLQPTNRLLLQSTSKPGTFQNKPWMFILMSITCKLTVQTWTHVGVWRAENLQALESLSWKEKINSRNRLSSSSYQLAQHTLKPPHLETESCSTSKTSSRASLGLGESWLAQNSVPSTWCDLCTLNFGGFPSFTPPTSSKLLSGSFLPL